MDFICPNCTKMITVPDQHAGQPMRCPLCQQTFQAPSLTSSAPVAAVPLSEPPPPPVEEEAYKLSPEPALAPPPKPLSAAPPRVESSRPQPKASAPPPPPPTPPAGYARKFSIQLSPQVLPWIPAVTLLLVFVLTFFNWVGMYPGGVSCLTQNAWQTLWGGYTLDPVFADITRFNEEKEAPGFSALTLFYLLTFLPAMLISVAVVLTSHLQIKLPHTVQQVWGWRFLVVAGLTLIPLFFLLVQSLRGYPLEIEAKEKIATLVKEGEPDVKRPKTSDEIRKSEIREGIALGAVSLHRTVWRSLAVLLHLLAPICALLAFWIDRRGPSRPLPRIEALW